VFLAAHRYRWNYNVVRNAVSVTKVDEQPQINPWISAYGVEVDTSILMDINHQALTVRQTNNPLASLLGGGLTLDLPFHIVLPQSAMNSEVSITSHLAPLFYLWGSPLDIASETLHEHGLDHTVLLTSSAQAWTIPADAQLTEDRLNPPASGGKTYPLGVLIRG
jgi:hypothetical protein